MNVIDQLKNVVNSWPRGIKTLLNDTLLFPVWYYVYTWGFWYRFIARTFFKVFDSLGLEVMLLNLLAPFRRDYTFAGYFVGIVIRVFWTVMSCIILSVITGILLILMLAFYLTPVFLGFVNLFEFADRMLKYYSFPELADAYSSTLWWLIPYFGVWFLYYLIVRNRQRYWERIKAGKLNTKLRSRVWRRLQFDPQEAEIELHQSKQGFIKYLHKHKMNEQDFLSAKRWVLDREYAKLEWKYWLDDFFFRKQGVNVGWVAGFLPELKHFSVDITKEAAENHVPHTYGRERELEKILTTLGRPTRNNVLIVGEAGVGKTSVVYSLAWLLLGIRKGFNLPTADYLIEPIEGRRVIELNTGGMVGAESRYASLEGRFSKALRELTRGETILFVNQVENLLQAGLIGYLTPIIRSTRFPIIATTTPKVYNKALANLPEFVSEFEVIRLQPPGILETVRILEGIANDLERKNPVFFTYPALHASIELSERYIHNSVLPEKAVKVLIKAVEMSARGVITEDSVEQAVAALSGVPVGDLSREESDKLINLEQLLQERIIGQDHAIRMVARALRRARTGVGAQDRPIASLLFLGSTGVGKTLTAKTLAQVYFTPQTLTNISEAQLNKLIEESFIRFDMSEFAEYGAVSTFIQRMTQAIQEKPFSLILLDEMEKAESTIHNLFLQIFEDGRLTSDEGDTADFRNSIIIATSNAITQVPENVDEDKFIREGLQGHFRPELINRFDGIVLFNPLQEKEIYQIVVLELSKLSKRIKTEHEIKITWTESLVQELAKLGYDPEFGARPLRRVIQDRIEDSLAQKLLRQELQFGDEYELSMRDLQ